MNYPELDVDALLPRLVDQLGTLIAVDAMEFPLEAIPCESPTHSSDKIIHDDGPGAMYLQIWHECSDVPGTVRVACARQAQVIGDRAEVPMKCLNCGHVLLTREFAAVIGPIGSMGKEAR